MRTIVGFIVVATACGISFAGCGASRDTQPSDGQQAQTQPPVDADTTPLSTPKEDANPATGPVIASQESSTPANTSTVTSDQSTDAVDVVFGADDPESLLKRVITAIDAKDRDKLISYIQPPTANEAEQLEAQIVAESLLAGVAAADAIAKGTKKFGEQQFKEAAGPTAAQLAAFAMTPQTFGQSDNDRSIEVQCAPRWLFCQCAAVIELR